jgi:hypothetical protein
MTRHAFTCRPACLQLHSLHFLLFSRATQTTERNNGLLYSVEHYNNCYSYYCLSRQRIIIIIIKSLLMYPPFTCQTDYTAIVITPWSESASELYRPSDRRLSAKLVPTFADRGCHVVSVTVPYCRILGFLDRTRYFSFK